MGLIKEYRIVLPMTVQEYRIAQIYMTARTQGMEAEQENGAGVEILENKPATHATMGKGIYTMKHYHIDRRFPGWLRAIAPKSGCTLVETAYNCYPWTRTEVRLPLFNKFLMVIESKHANDRGDTENIHNLTPEQLSKREVVWVDIAEAPEQDKKKKMYENDDADPRTFLSKRTGRGQLQEGWQKRVEPVMCAYKLVTAEFDYWPLSSTIEPFMHSYEKGIFQNANRQMFCWIDDWHGLTEEQVKLYEDAVAERTNKITAIKEGRAQGIIKDIPQIDARELVAKRSDNQAATTAPPPTLNGEAPAGTQFTCFAGTKVQILTLQLQSV